MHDIGEYRSLLAQPPSKFIFEAVCDLLDDSSAHHDEMVITYLKGHFDRWPDNINRIIPMLWMDYILDSSWENLFQICTVFSNQDLAFNEQRVKEMIGASSISHLSGIILGYVDIGDDYEDYFQHLKRFDRLKTLDLRCANLKDNSLKNNSFIEKTWTLQKIHLQNNHLTSVGVENLMEHNLSGLKYLDLRYNKIDAEGASMLANTSMLRNLEVLHLYHEDVDINGLEILSKSKYLNDKIKTIFKYRFDTVLNES